MANTIIQLKHSTVQGNIPVSLANGEISINTRDGKLFYSDPTGTVQEFSGFTGPSGLNREVQFNDSGVLGANALFTFNKTLPALNVGGVSLTNTYIQFGDGTRQYTANGAATDQVARNTANAAFLAANAATATDTTQNNSITAAFATANSAFHQANAAYTRANNSLNANTGGTVTGTITATSFVTTGTFGDIQGANAIYANTFVANTGGYFQFADGSKQYTANAGSGGGGAITVTVAADPPASGNVSGDIWIDANTGNEFTWFTDGDSYQWVELGPIGEKGDKGDTGDVAPGFNQANAAFIVANASFIQANAAFIQANTNATNITVIQGVNLTQNTNISNIEGVNLTQNTNISNIEGVNLTQNTNITNAQNSALAAFDHANAAFIQANTNAGNITTIQGVNLTQNTSISDLQGVNLTQNTSISNLEGVNLTQNTNITNAQNKADSAFDQANAAFIQANTNSSDITVIQGVNLTQNTNITNAQNSASAAYIRANNSLNANVGGVITGPVTISANLTVTGNLTVIGNTITTDIQSLNIGDPLIYLAANNYSGDAVEIGFAANYYDGSTQRHTGVFREASNKEYYVFDNYTPEPDANLIDINDGSFRVATLNANLKSQSITLNGQNLQTYTDNAYNTANAAFIQANTNAGNITAIQGVNVSQNNRITYAENHANAAFNAANNATDTYVRAHANSAFDQANAAFIQANTNAGNITVIQGVNLTQNTSISDLQAVNVTQNNRITYAENHANAAFNAANNATDTYVRAHANAAFDHANAAYDKANTGGGNITITIDSFTGTGSCTQFTLSVTPTNENYTIVSFDGAVQHKSTYNLSGSVITFSEAPANATEIDITSFVTLGTSAFLAYNEQFAGTGACTTFTLTNTPNDENYTVVSIDGAVQHKSTYSLSGASVIFSEAPPNTSEIDVTYFKSSTLLDSNLTVYAANHANSAFIQANSAFNAANTITVINGLFFTG